LTEFEKQIFLKFLLHSNKFSIGKAISLTQYVLKTQGVKYIPAPPTFRRFANWYKANYFDKWTLLRDGEKALKEQVIPYIKKDISKIEVGEVLVADGKRFKIDEAEVGVNFPPMHPNCRSTTQLDLNTIDEDKIVDEDKEKEAFNQKNAKKRIEEFSEKNKDIEKIMQNAEIEQQKLQKDWEYADKKYKEYNRKRFVEQDEEAEKQANYWYEKGKELYIKKRDLPEKIGKDLIENLNQSLNSIKVRATSQLTEIGKELENQINKIVNKKIAPNKTLDLFDTDSSRSFFDPKTNTLNMAEDVLLEHKTHKLFHEAMHWLEHNDSSVLNKSVAFLEYRTKGEEIKKLSELTGNNKYKVNEIAKKDHFFSPYCGKIYKYNDEYYATEILSKGLEEIYTNPLEFYNNDKEYFNFVIGVLQGKL
jgi:hypothetical protein